MIRESSSVDTPMMRFAFHELSKPSWNFFKVKKKFKFYKRFCRAAEGVWPVSFHICARIRLSFQNIGGYRQAPMYSPARGSPSIL